MSINGRVYEDGLNKKYIYIGGRRIVVDRYKNRRQLEEELQRQKRK